MFTKSYVLYVHTFSDIYTYSSEIPDMQLCYVLLYSSITASALEAEAETAHTSDSGVFMMAETSSIWNIWNAITQHTSSLQQSFK